MTKGKTARDIQLPLNQIDFDQIPLWEESELNDAFIRIRDEKWLYCHKTPDFKRSVPWLFVDNGCYLRAALIRKKLEGWGYPPIKKIFVFGEMEFFTPLHPNGKMTYKDHVAVIVRTKSGCFVFDPPINFKAPLYIKDWINSLQPAELKSCLKFSICSPLTLGHNSLYNEADPNREVGLRNGKEMPVDFFTQEFLNKEWSRLDELGLDPSEILNDPYPWKKFDSAKHPNF